MDIFVWSYGWIDKDGCGLEKTIPSDIGRLIKLNELILGKSIFFLSFKYIEKSYQCTDRISYERLDCFFSFSIHAL